MCDCVLHQLSFKFKNFVIFQMLQLASTTFSKIWTKWFYSIRARN